MDNTLKYETREQFINRFHSLIYIDNNKYVWYGDLNKNDEPIFKFNGITLFVKEMIKVWEPGKHKIKKNKIINKNIIYNNKGGTIIN
jgi:hypothetical protein